MLGRCQEKSEGASVFSRGWHDRWLDTWEACLIWEDDHAQTAVGFATRFCPEHLDEAEATSARATERAWLAMSPSRDVRRGQ